MDMQDKEDIGEYVFRKLREGLLALPEEVTKNLAGTPYIAPSIKLPIWNKPHFEYTLNVRVLFGGNLQLTLTDMSSKVVWDLTTQ